ncbi:MAG: hypothetical protein JO048_07800, partial [Methylobacteriaceae bacterium]|nr:hypothetical protein [Methylobacteriaceae bacterium]
MSPAAAEAALRLPEAERPEIGSPDEHSAARPIAPDPTPLPWIGRPLRRVEDERLLRGQGRFVGDLAPAGCLHLAFARSASGAGRIGRLDLAAARGAPGVVAALSGVDVRGLGAAAV